MNMKANGKSQIDIVADASAGHVSNWEKRRIAVKKYTHGNTYAHETNNDGGVVIEDLIGSREAGQPILAYLELLCDDTESGFNRALDAIHDLIETIKARKNEI